MTVSRYKKAINTNRNDFMSGTNILLANCRHHQASLATHHPVNEVRHAGSPTSNSTQCHNVQHKNQFVGVQ